MSEGILVAVVGILGSVLSSFVTYLIGKRKYDADVEALKSQNYNTIMETYKAELKSMSDRLTEYINGFDAERVTLRKQLEDNENRIFELEQVIESQKEKIVQLESQLENVNHQ